MRMIEGSSKEYFWQLAKHPLTMKRKFVRGLVHATMADANGYVEGVTKQQLDSFINAAYDEENADTVIPQCDSSMSSFSSDFRLAVRWSRSILNGPKSLA